jgi:hypothetical protein
MKDYVPNPVIVEKAVELWVQMLINPKYDHIGDSEPMKFEYFATMIMADMLPKNSTPEIMEKFKVALRGNLLSPFETKYMQNGKEVSYSKMVTYLSVDYDPDLILRDAAEKAGLKTKFPWKTSMRLTDSYVTVSYGYGAEYVFFYPLSDNRWFVTTLYGSDMDKVIKLIEDAVISTELEEVIC